MLRECPGSESFPVSQSEEDTENFSTGYGTVCRRNETEIELELGSATKFHTNVKSPVNNFKTFHTQDMPTGI